MTTMDTIKTIRTQNIDTLNDLLQITRDSAKFYNKAATEVSNPHLQTLFSDLGQTKEKLVGEMSREIKAVGETPAVDGTVRGAMNRFYTDVRSRFGDTDYTYVKDLEATEDRLLKAYDNVVNDKDVSPVIKQTVKAFLPKIQASRDAIHARKWEMERKH